MGEQKGLFSGLGSTLSTSKASFNARLSHYQKDKNLVLATYLDPRFKTSFLEKEYKNQPVEDAIEAWLAQEIYIINEGKCRSSGEIAHVREVTHSSDMCADKKKKSITFVSNKLKKK